jgi:hypothetical protein
MTLSYCTVISDKKKLSIYLHGNFLLWKWDILKFIVMIKSKTIFPLLAKCQGHTSHFKNPENIKFEEKNSSNKPVW